MAGSTLFVVFVAALTCMTDAAITEWNGADTTTVGAGIYTFEVPEGIATAASPLTVTATSTEAVTYTLAEQTPANGPFTIADTSVGVITFTSPLDFETSPTHTLKITATDNAETGAGVSATATVTITVKDVHSFAKDKDSVCVPDGTTEGETVATLDIADAIAVPAYVIDGTGKEKFKVADGKVIVDTGKTITSGDGDPYTLTIKQGQDTDTLTLTVTVGDCSTASLLAPLGLLTLLMALIATMN